MSANDNSTVVPNNPIGPEYLRGIARWWVALSQPEDVLEGQYLCVDTDVITMFHTPASGAGYTTLRFLGAGKVDDGRHSAAAASLAGELARYILFELETSKQTAIHPRLLLPGHASEVMRKFLKLQDDAEKVLREAEDELEGLTDLAKQVAECISAEDGNAVKDQLSDAIASFVSRWLGQGGNSPGVVLDSAMRFAELLAIKEKSSSEKILNVTQYRFGEPFVEPYGGRLPNIALELSFDEKCEKYCKRFRVSEGVFAKQRANIESGQVSSGVVFGNIKAYNHATDAYAMAWLECINEAAVGRLGGKSHVNPYCVLISGASLLNKGTGPLVVDPLYLMPSLLKQLQSDEIEIAEELSRLVGGILYPIFRSQHSQDISEEKFDLWCQKLAHGESESADMAVFDNERVMEKLGEIESAWERLCQAIAAKSNRSESLFDKIRSVLQEVNSDIDEAQWLARVRELFADAKLNLVSKASALQPSLRMSHPLLPRNPPPVRLEEFSDAKQIADDAILLSRTQPDRSRFQKVVDDTDGFSPDKPYLSLLLTGIVESATGNWKLARVVFWAAYVLGRREPPDSKITGRDAAYALAIACRVTASKKTVVADFRTCAQYLDEARKADDERHLDERGPRGDIRFRAEELALSLSKLWTRLAHPDLVAPELLQGKRSLIDSARKIMDSAFDLYRDLKRSEEKGKYPYLWEYVFQQTCCILIQAWLLTRYIYFQGTLYSPSAPSGTASSDIERLKKVLEDIRTQSGRLSGGDNFVDPKPLPMHTPASKILTVILARELGERVESDEALGALSLCEKAENWNFLLIDKFRRMFFELLLIRLNESLAELRKQQVHADTKERKMSQG